MKNIKEKFGPWAIVTGASSGIGKEFANQLASDGINLVLLARRENLLEELASKLQEQYAVQVKYLPLDLTSETFLEEIIDFTNGLDIRLLVSNAGVAYMGAFNKSPMEQLSRNLNLNVNTQMKLSHWFTSKLSTENKKGGLLLVSSTVAYQGIPYSANYSGAKSYVLNLGEALNVELRNKGINVTVLVPGPTDAPGLTDRTDADMVNNLPMKPQPVDQLVKEGLSALLKNKPSQIGGTLNRTMTKVMLRVMSRNQASAFWGKMVRKMVVAK